MEEFAYQRGGEEVSDIELEEDSCVSPSDHTYNCFDGSTHHTLRTTAVWNQGLLLELGKGSVTYKLLTSVGKEQGIF